MYDQAAPEYLFDISHASPASSETSACSVEPRSSEDVSKIVRQPDPTHQLLPTRIFIATYLGIKPNAICGERWRAHHEPRVFLDDGRTDRHVTLQRDKSQLHLWDS